MPKKTRNMDAVRDCLKQFETAANLMRAILDGEKSQAQVARELDISRAAMQNQVERGFRPYIKSKMLNITDIYAILEKNRSAGDLALLTAMGEYDAFAETVSKIPDKFVYLPPYDEDNLWDAIRNRLTDREYRVFTVILFNISEGRSRAEAVRLAGAEYCVTRERIRQIYAKAVRKLRHGTVLTDAWPEMKMIQSGIMEYLSDYSARHFDAYERALFDYNRAKRLCTATEALQEAAELLTPYVIPVDGNGPQNGSEATSKPVTLQELYDRDSISLRTLNVCRRAGFSNLNELAALSPEQLMSIRNLGRTGLSELAGLFRSELDVERLELGL